MTYNNMGLTLEGDDVVPDDQVFGAIVKELKNQLGRIPSSEEVERTLNNLGINTEEDMVVPNESVPTEVFSQLS